MWFADASDKNSSFPRFVTIMSGMFTSLLRHFLNPERTRPRESDSSQSSLSLRTMPRANYASITNLFQITPTSNPDEPVRRNSIVVSPIDDETVTLSDDVLGSFVIPLEERAVQRRVFARELSRAFYGSSTTVDIWLALQKFDRFVNGETTHLKDEDSAERDQLTRMREISKFL